MEFEEFKKQYDELTENNDHTTAAKLLVDRYGTYDDKFSISIISANHSRTGKISTWDMETRDAISKKYRDFLRYPPKKV